MKSIPIIKALTQTEFAKSNSEAKRLIHQGAVNIGEDRIKITDPNCSIEILEEGTLLRVGSKKTIRIVGGYETSFFCKKCNTFITNEDCIFWKKGEDKISSIPYCGACKSDLEMKSGLVGELADPLFSKNNAEQA